MPRGSVMPSPLSLSIAALAWVGCGVLLYLWMRWTARSSGGWTVGRRREVAFMSVLAPVTVFGIACMIMAAICEAVFWLLVNCMPSMKLPSPFDDDRPAKW